MERIVKVLLQEGINEDTIHEVLDILSEDVYDTINKKKENGQIPVKRALELDDKLDKARSEEAEGAAEREGREYKDVHDRRKWNKNNRGEVKTELRRK